MDWQTLLRPPCPAAIVFNSKALFTPVTELRNEPAVLVRVARVLKEGKRSLVQYKGVRHVAHVVLPKLEECSKEKEEQGVVRRTGRLQPWMRVRGFEVGTRSGIDSRGFECDTHGVRIRTWSGVSILFCI